MPLYQLLHQLQERPSNKLAAAQAVWSAAKFAVTLVCSRRPKRTQRESSVRELRGRVEEEEADSPLAWFCKVWQPKLCAAESGKTFAD